MGYVDLSTLHTPIGGARPPAAYGRQIEANFDFLASPPKCRVYSSANLSIPNNTPTALTFDSERYDTDSMHSTSTNTERITLTTAGSYDVGVGVAFDGASSTGYRDLYIRLNGTTIIAYGRQMPVTGGISTVMPPIVTTYAFAAGDYIEAIVTQTSGSALNVNASPNFSPEFWATWRGQ